MGALAGWYPHPDDPTKELHFDGTSWGDSRVLRFDRNKQPTPEAAGWYPHPTAESTEMHYDGDRWAGTRVLQLASGDYVEVDSPEAAEQVLTATSAMYEPQESRGWTIAKRFLAYGPLAAIAIVGIIAFMSQNGN